MKLDTRLRQKGVSQIKQDWQRRCALETLRIWTKDTAKSSQLPPKRNRLLSFSRKHKTFYSTCYFYLNEKLFLHFDLSHGNVALLLNFCSHVSNQVIYNQIEFLKEKAF